MRIFVHNCNTYIGKALVKELRKDERGFNRIFGCQTAAGGAPEAVKRISTRDDPKKAKRMEEAIRSCAVVVLDLFNCTMQDLHFVLQALKVDPKANPPKRMGDIEDKDGNRKESLTFILVSSAMTWANSQLPEVVETPSPRDGEEGAEGAEGAEEGAAEGAAEGAEGGSPRSSPRPKAGPKAFSEAMFEQRTPVPGSKYEQWRDMENLVRTCFSLEGSQVRSFIVGAGVLYGDGEDTFAQLFKDAWRGTQSHTITSPGTNIIPTAHVRDVARLVRQVAYNQELVPAERPYFLAVDKIEDGATEPTQAEIIKGIVGEVNGPYNIPLVDPPPAREPVEEGEEAAAAHAEAGPEPGSEEAAAAELAEAMALNLRMEPSNLMLDPETFTWHCDGGILKHMRTVAEEFCTERKLRALRVIVAGPPASGKSTLCQAIAEHFNMPPLTMNLEDLEATRKELCSEVCRYRGYVLNAGLAGWKEVEQLFCEDFVLPVDPDADPPPEPEEGEEAKPPEPQTERRLSEAGIVPRFAILLQSPEGLSKARFMNAKKGAEAKFSNDMATYTSRNLVDGQMNIADFFQDVAKIGVYNLPIANKAEEDMFESTRIFMESGEGRPFNYLESAEEVAEKLIAQREEQDVQFVAAKSLQLEREVSGGKESEAHMKRHLERLRIIGEHEAEQNALADLPLRECLMRHMVPNLTEGLIEMCRVMPDNPVDYLANYLEQHAAREQIEN